MPYYFCKKSHDDFDQALLEQFNHSLSNDQPIQIDGFSGHKHL